MEGANLRFNCQRSRSVGLDWIRLSSVLRPLQHSIGYMGDGFYRSKDPKNSGGAAAAVPP